MKKLSDMTLEELWQLFPIFLTEHKEIWKNYYSEMEKFLKTRLYKFAIVRISHIGSTAVENIYAKPIIDMLLEIKKGENMQEVALYIVKCGFIKMSETKDRMSFNYGYTEKGLVEKVYHLHLRYEGDNDELYFRDFLNNNQDIAKEYEKLKLSLWKKYEHNRDGYTNAKSEFIKKYTLIAKEKYKYV